MNRQEQLLKNYILSEIYNIEKESFLLESADLLEEGKIWDWAKSKLSKYKNIFSLSQKQKKAFEDEISKAQRAGKTERAKELEAVKSSIENKKFSNYNKMILSLITLVSLSIYGNLDEVDVESGSNQNTNTSEVAEASGVDDVSILYYLKGKGVAIQDMGSFASELDAQNPGDNPVLRAFEGLIKSDKVSLYGMPPGQSISKEAFVKYLAWEFNNERPQGMNMYEHYKEFIAAVIRGGEYEKNKEAAIKQRKEDTATHAALLGLDEGTLLYYPEEIIALSEDERSTYVDNIIQGLEGEEFMNRYIDAYAVDKNYHNDPGQGPIRDTSVHLRSLIDNPAISHDQRKELKGVYANYYMMSNACAFLNDPRDLPISQLSSYVNPEHFEGIYKHVEALHKAKSKDN